MYDDNTKISVGTKVVGEVVGDTFHKHITGSKHLLKKPPAIAFDISTLNDAERAGAKYVEILDKESGTVYRVSIVDIYEYGFTFNRGWGLQIGLTLSDFHTSEQHPQLAFGGQYGRV